MDFIFFILLCIFSCIFSYILTSIFRPKKPANLPPGPSPARLMANILRLSRSPHQTLAQLSKIYGPLMHFKLGIVNTVVASSPEFARQVLQKHDHLLSGRFTQVISEYDRHTERSVVLLPPSTRWRHLRRTCKEHIFSLHRLNATQGIRHENINKLREHVKNFCDAGRVLDISEAAFVTSQNILSQTIFSMNFSEIGSTSSTEFKRSLQGLLRVSGTSNIADYFPFLRNVDPQGLKRKSEFYFKNLLRIFDEIIDERLKSRRMDSEMKNDVMEELLQKESGLNRNDITHLLLDLFLAGVDTSATTIEWVMAELIRNPEKMAKGRNELNSIVKVEEFNILKLPYLQAVVKETLRLHPPGPFLLPHKAEDDTEINGYIVPKNSQVLVNIWAIGRDSSIWPNPNSFEPERFIGNKVDVRGQDFELIPFGSGRRICLGLSLGYVVVHLVVATLIRGFNWKPEKGIREEELDMEEKFEFTVKKALALKALPVEVNSIYINERTLA